LGFGHVIPVLITLAACAGSLSLPGDDAEALLIIMASLAAPGEERLAFVEERQSPLFDETIIVSGYLERLSDDTLVKVIEEPLPRRLSLGPEIVRVESAGRTRETSISRHPALAGLRSGMIGLIDRDAVELLRVFQPSVEDGEDGWRLELLPREKKIARNLKRLVVHGCGETLIAVDVWLADGTVEHMQFVVPRSGGAE
jgi:hypothetical protein